MNDQTPALISLEAIELLKSRLLAPTPLNYQAAYQEVNGTRSAGLSPEDLLCKIAEYLSASTAALYEQRRAMVQAIRDHNWSGVRQALLAYGELTPAPSDESTASESSVQASLLKLLHLSISNMGGLGLEDHWFKGTLDGLLETINPPLTMGRLTEVERRLRDLIFKHSKIKQRVQQSQEQMRQMLAAFVERLQYMTELSGSYHRHIETAALALRQAQSIEEIAPVLSQLMEQTLQMERDSKNTQQELSTLRSEAHDADTEIKALKEELDRVSHQARNDGLTDALNRKGLNEVMEREIAHSKRKQSALCLALLDLDNFKDLNDSHGHAVGDQALVHLVTLARQGLRPDDSVARYGGEEFVILMPDSDLNNSLAVIQRIAKLLTSQPLLHGGEKIAVTFSAGVAQVQADESASQVLLRADRAMYQAKKTGKNKVLTSIP